jgi:lycopene cyclase domain-containing protein
MKLPPVLKNTVLVKIYPDSASQVKDKPYDYFSVFQESQKDDIRLSVGLLVAAFLAAYAAMNMGSMTYLKLHVFLIVPEIWMRFTPRQPLQWASETVRKVGFLTTIPLAIAAVLFSSCWDNFIFSKGVFTFDQGSMIGTLGAMPIEEWIWFVDHTTLASIATVSLMRPRSAADIVARLASGPRPRGARDYAVAAACLAISAAGIACVCGPDQHLLLLGVVAAFMPPVLALQWCALLRLPPAPPTSRSRRRSGRLPSHPAHASAAADVPIVDAQKLQAGR